MFLDRRKPAESRQYSFQPFRCGSAAGNQIHPSEILILRIGTGKPNKTELDLRPLPPEGNAELRIGTKSGTFHQPIEQTGENEIGGFRELHRRIITLAPEPPFQWPKPI